MLNQALLEHTFPFKASFAVQRDGTLLLSCVIATRKAFLANKQLTYRCRVRTKEDAKEVLLFESLEEKGTGLTAMGDDDSDNGFGAGFKVEHYDTRRSTHQPTIEEQSRQFANTYQYTFDCAQVRGAVEALAAQEGYTVRAGLGEREVIRG